MLEAGPRKPSVTLGVPADPDRVSSFLNIRVVDIQACYELWKSRGAEFITELKQKYGEIRCYIRDPDGYNYRGRTEHRPHVRLTLGRDRTRYLSADGCESVL
jgi:uncharacterized glyoxalase superfamily protein PhnB